MTKKIVSFIVNLPHKLENSFVRRLQNIFFTSSPSEFCLNDKKGIIGD